MAVTTPLCFLAVYVIQRFYLKTSRQLRLLDLEAKAPLYSKILEILNSLVTLRAFQWQSHLLLEIEALVDASQRPLYLLYCVQRWLTLVLDLLSAALAIILVSLAVTVKTSTNGGYVGVALVNIMMFNTGITDLVKYWTVMETSLGAISRVRTFEQDTESEVRPLVNMMTNTQPWPSAGTIDFKNVCATYVNKADEPSMQKSATSAIPALRDITFSVSAGEKVAICGRTGRYGRVT